MTYDPNAIFNKVNSNEYKRQVMPQVETLTKREQVALQIFCVEYAYTIRHAPARSRYGMLVAAFNAADDFLAYSKETTPEQQ
jgi:hypothetical protein